MLTKLLTLEKAAVRLKKDREGHKKVVFTNGCFDILHAGHVRYLSAAKEHGDVLVVGLNSDRSVREIKGDKHPLILQTQRAETLAGLKCVDIIILFDEPDPLVLIKRLKPDVLVKGDDWPEDQIVGADFVKDNGGSVIRVPLLQGVSTSKIIEKILTVYDQNKAIERFE